MNSLCILRLRACRGEGQPSSAFPELACAAVFGRPSPLVVEGLVTEV